MEPNPIISDLQGEIERLSCLVRDIAMRAEELEERVAALEDVAIGDEDYEDSVGEDEECELEDP